MSDQLAVVMPVYNEQQVIEQVCLEWLTLLEGRLPGVLIVVDDGSRDATPALLDRLAGRTRHIRVVRQANSGHGAAVLKGYHEALAAGCAWIFQVDSDGQFRAEDFERLWQRRAEADLLLGERVARRDPWLRILLSAAHRVLLRFIFGVRIPDPNIPFRLMRAGALATWLQQIPPETFAPNVLLSVLAARERRLLAGIPVRHFPRPGGAASIRGLKALRVGWRCLKELAAFRRRFERL